MYGSVPMPVLAIDAVGMAELVRVEVEGHYQSSLEVVLYRRLWDQECVAGCAVVDGGQTDADSVG